MPAQRTNRSEDKWLHVELDNLLDEALKKDDGLEDSAFLVSNPGRREELKNLIMAGVWPGILRAFEGTELILDPVKTAGELELRQEWERELALSFVLLVFSEEDTGMRLGDAPYFCRITVKCAERSYMLNTDFYIHFPESMDMNRLKPLLGNPKFAGSPPKLTYEVGFDGEPGTLLIGFEHGQGHGYFPALDVSAMVADLAERVNFIRRLIRAVRALSDNYDSDENLRYLNNELVKCFQAD